MVLGKIAGHYLEKPATDKQKHDECVKQLPHEANN